MTKTLAGWRILEDLGTDALGSSHLAVGPAGEKGLLRLLPDSFAGPPVNAVMRETFARAALLQHPNVVGVRDVSDGRDGFPPRLVEEHVSGVPLAALLEMNVKLMWTSALLVLHEVAQALAYAHRQGVLHGDLSPKYVMVAKSGQVKVRGFGLEHLLAVAGLQTPRAVPATPKDDVRALGRLAHQLVVGAVVGGVEGDLGDLRLPEGYKRLLALEHAREPGTIQEVLALVRSLLAEAGTSDVQGALRRTFEELSFFFLVAGSPQGDEDASPPMPPETAAAPAVTGSLLDEQEPADPPQEPYDRAAEPRDPDVWLGGPVDESADKPGDPGAPEEALLPLEAAPAVPQHEPAARRVASVEFDRIAKGTSSLVWYAIGVLVLALVVVAILAVRSVLRDDPVPGPADELLSEAPGASPQTGTPGEPKAEDAGATPPKKAPVAPVEPARRPESEAAEKRATELLSDGKPVEARAVLQAAIDEDPGDGALRVAQARTFVATESYNDAARVLGEAIRADRTLTEAYVLLGEVEMARSNPREAAQAMQHVLDKRGNDADFLLNLALAHKASDQLDVAQPLLLQALAVRPEFPRADMALAEIHEAQRSTAKAIHHYERAAEDRSLAPTALLRVVRLQERRGKLAEVKTLLLERLAADPSFALLRLLLADVLYRERQYDEARPHLERYLELEPESIPARLALANVIFHERRYADAAAAYRAVLELDPTEAVASHNLGMALLSMRDTEGAAAAFEQAAGSVWQSHCELARIDQKAGRLDRAREHYQATLKGKPDHPWVRQIVNLRLDSGQADYLMTKPCDDREILDVSLDPEL